MVLAHHVGHGGARAEKGRAQVQAEHEIPVLRAHLPDLGVAAAADVVHEDVDASEPIDRGVDQPARPFLFGQVTGDGQRGASGRDDRGDRPLEP